MGSFGIGCSGQIQVDGEDVARIETGIGAAEPAEAADHETGAGEQDQGDGGLEDDQELAGPLPPRALGRPPALADQDIQVTAGGLQGWGEPEENTGQQGYGGREEQHPGIDPGLEHGRQVDRIQTDQDIGAPVGQQDTEYAANRRQNQGFDKELTHQAPASGSHRHADGDLAASRSGPGQEQVGHVGTDDEQHQRHRAQQDPERAPDPFHTLAVDRLDQGADPFVQIGVLGAQVGRNGPDLLGDLCESHPVGHPADDEHAVLPPETRFRVDDIRGPDTRLDAQHLPQKSDRRRELKAFGHDPDDGVWASVELDRGADDLGVGAELVAPPAVFEQGNRFGPRECFLAGIDASQHGLDAEQVKELGGCLGALHTLRIADTEDVVGVESESGHADQGFALGLVVEEVGCGEGHTGVAHLRGALPDRNQPVGFVVRQGAQQDSVDNTEDGGVAADPDRQGQDRYDREDRSTLQVAQGEGYITADRADRLPPPALLQVFAVDIPALVVNAVDVTEASHRFAAGFFGVHTRGPELFDAAFEMVGKLIIETALQVPAGKIEPEEAFPVHRAHTCTSPARPRSRGATSSTSRTARVWAIQSPSSVCSSFSPAAVRV